jgi:hypothetical protein
MKRAIVRSRAHWPTLAAAGFVGALAICLAWPGFKELQADSYRLLYAGRYIAQHGIPHHEVFTLAAAGHPFADQQWLAELVDYEAWRIGGYAGLALLSAIVFGSGYALLAALLRRRGASVALAVSCGALAIFGALSLIFVRAQLFAIPLFVLILWLCLGDAGASRLRLRIVLVLPLLALWANLHGSVLIGAGLVAAYFGFRAVGMGRRREWRPALAYGALAAGAALTVLATPYGTHVLAYYRDMVGNQAVRLADVEWDAPAFPALPFFQFAIPLLLAGGSLLVSMRRGRRPSWTLVGATALTGLAAWFAMRDNVWLGIVAAVLVAETAPVWLPTEEAKPSFVRALALGGAALAALGVGRLATRAESGFQGKAPLQAVAAAGSYAASHPCTRVLADNTSASALLWLDPALTGRVAFDGELEAYPQAALVRWVSFQSAGGPDWLAAADGYQILIGTTADQPRLVRRLGQLSGGAVLGHDSRGIAVLNGAARYTGACGGSTLSAGKPNRGPTDA